jgi:adenylate kinase
MKILIMGPPGAGKGTIAEMLQKEFGIIHLSSGDIIKLMKEKLSEESFILDGFPRNLAQVKKLEDENIKIDMVLNLKVNEKTIISRLSGRRICTKCGKIYHLENMPPKKDGICDICGGELYQREDDKPETIKRRLKTYKDQTEGLIKYYSEKGILNNIDANGKKEATYDKIINLQWLKKRRYKSKVK